MKKVYHICLSGGKEVMFRDREDYIRGINCLSLATYKTKTSLLAYAFMSNHVHLGVRCKDPKKLIQTFRYSYIRYFNYKYGRRGRLGERNFFQIEIEGLYHFLAAISYILRNPLHHGITATPFGYDFSSIDAIFAKELGRSSISSFMPKKSQYLYLPRNHTLPSHYIMNDEGLIIPESVVDVADVERQFSSARAFVFYMNRLSGNDWYEEQLKDTTNKGPITLDEIEKGVSGVNIKTMLKNEHGKANYKAPSDIQLCYEIDKVILPKLRIKSVYNLSLADYDKILKMLRGKYYIAEEQLQRCLPNVRESKKF